MSSRLSFTGRERSTLIGVLVLFSTTTFEETAVVAALPTAARDLGGIGSFGWLYTGFVVAKIVGLAVAGQYGDSHGPRPVLISGLALSIAAIVMCGCAPTMTLLIVGRFVQGSGAGLLIIAVYIVIGQVFSDESVPKIQSAIGSSFVVPSLVGPLLAGAVAQHVGWRWVFLGLVPFMLLAVALLLPVLRSLRHVRQQSMRRNSLPFAIAVGAAVAALAYVGQLPPRWAVVLPAAVVAVGLLAWGLRALLPPGTYRMRPGVAAPIALRAIYGGAFLGAEALVPLTLTLQHGYAATLAALPLAVSDPLWALGSWIQGRTPKRDEREYRVRLVRAGFGLTAVGTLVAAAVAYPSVPGWWMFAGWCLAGLGAGLAYTTFNVLVLRQTTDADRGFDSAASQLSGNVGQAITTALGGVLIAAAARGTVGFGTAFMTVNLTMAAMLIFGYSRTGRLRASVPA